MENLKVVVSGAFKEKAMLLSVIGDALTDKDISFEYKDPFMDRCIRDNTSNDCVTELTKSNIEVSLELENLQNTNVIEDLTKLYNELDQLFIDGVAVVQVDAVKLKERIGQILLIS